MARGMPKPNATAESNSEPARERQTLFVVEGDKKFCKEAEVPESLRELDPSVEGR